jgi:protein ImuB
MTLPRMVTVWYPEWPVAAAGFAPDVPAAVMHANRVVARTAAAAADGVVVGQRRRQAQQRCPAITLVDRDADRDAREFESVVRAVGELSPRLDVIEPGWISFAARGPSRYFGGDQGMCEQLAERLAGVDVPGGARPGIGVADGRFASGVAARLAVPRGAAVVVEPATSPAFCATLPIGWLQTLGEVEPELVELFGRLGLRRLGDLAALPAADVLGRFGPPGVHAHRLAAGRDERPAGTIDPPVQRRLDHALGDPVEQSSAVVFIAKQLADELAGALEREGRVCTRLVVLLESEHGERSERSWYRADGMTAPAMVERVRWQLDAWINLPRGSDHALTSGITLVRLTPDEVRADDGHQLRLWGGQTEADRHAARAIARLTTLTSEHAVTVPVWRGGRLAEDRYRWVPATMVDLDRRTVVPSPAHPAVRHQARLAARRRASDRAAADDDGPWPGALPSPSPATVYADPRPVEVLDEHGALVQVSARGLVSASPVALRFLSGDDDTGWRRGKLQRIVSWAGPWPVEERWWEPEHARRLARFQVVADADGHEAFVVVAEHRRWWVSARYD